MIWKILFLLLLGAIIAAAIGRARVRAKQARASEVPEINQHPERLEETLDPTDDA